MRKILVAISLLATGLCPLIANGQASDRGFLLIENIGGIRTYVGTGANAKHIGSGVLVNLHTVADTFGTSFQFLVACDGTWALNQINLNYVSGEGLTPQVLEEKSQAVYEAYPLDIADIQDWQQKSDTLVKPLRPYLKAVCKGAMPEPKNIAIPLSSYSEDGKKPGGTASFLSGTVVRKGALLDAWFRIANYKREPTMYEGKPWVLNGVAQMSKVATGAYQMQKVIYDCVNRQSTSTQLLEYNKEGSIVNQQSIQRDKAAFSEVVPGTVGEVNLDSLCRIYTGITN